MAKRAFNTFNNCLCKSDCVEQCINLTKSKLLCNADDVVPKEDIFGDDLTQKTTNKKNDEIVLQKLLNFNTFFKETYVQVVLKEARSYLEQTILPTLAPGLEKLVQERPDNPMVWLADWLVLNNPYHIV